MKVKKRKLIEEIVGLLKDAYITGLTDGEYGGALTEEEASTEFFFSAQNAVLSCKKVKVNKDELI